MARRKVAAKNKTTKDTRKTSNADNNNGQPRGVKVKSKGKGAPVVPLPLEPPATVMTSTASTVSTIPIRPPPLFARNADCEPNAATHVPDTHPPASTIAAEPSLSTASPATMVFSTTALPATSSAPKNAIAAVSTDHNKYLHKKFKRIASASLDETPSPSPPVSVRHSTPDQPVDGPTVSFNSVRNGRLETTYDQNPLANGPNGFQMDRNKDAADRLAFMPEQQADRNVGQMRFNEATEASATAKANAPSPLLHERNQQFPNHCPSPKYNHHNNNNNYSSSNNNNNNLVQPQPPTVYHQSNGSSSPVVYPPMIVPGYSSNTNFVTNLRPSPYHPASPSPNSMDTHLMGIRAATEHVPSPETAAHVQKQQQLLFQQHMLQQQQFQNNAMAENAPQANLLGQITPAIAPQTSQQQSSSESPTPGRYVCPFCQLNCAKPSVLQKHIRAHTNERPYPCVPCGFAFKTRSNLYKHCRSRAHAMRLQGGEPQPDDEASLGSDPDQDLSSSASSDVFSRTASPLDDRVSSPSGGSNNYAQIQSSVLEKPYKPKFHNASHYANDEQQQQMTNRSSTQKPQIPQKTQPSIIVQTPAPFSQLPSCSTPSTSSISHPLSTQNVEYLKEHISKIISQNEAIMEVVEPALQKKYHKITGISRGHMVNESTNSKLAIALLKQREESNNLAQVNTHPATSSSSSPSNKSQSQPSGVSSSSSAAVPGPSGYQRRSLPTLRQHAQQAIQSQVAAVAQQPQHHQNSTTSSPLNLSRLSIDVLTNTHPQNPERSIIKDLLLNSRGLAVPSGGEGNLAVYTCPLCKISFQSANDLQSHTQICQGHNGSPQSAPISPVGSPSHKYFRSNSFNVNLPEKYNPNTLAKLASSTLKHPSKTPPSLAKLAQTQIRPGRSKPDNIVINTETCPAPTPIDSKPGCSSTASMSAQCVQITRLIEVDTPLPSPGPLLGKTRLVDAIHQTFDRKTEEAIVSHFPENDVVYQKHRAEFSDENKSAFVHGNTKRSRLSEPFGLSTPNRLFSESPTGTHRMSGGEVKLIERDILRHDSDNNYSPIISPNTMRNQRMCGGDFKIVDRREELRNQPHFGSSGGSIVSISPSASPQLQSYADQNGISMQMVLNSGGSMMDTHPANHTPKLPITPGTYFQYPINTITGYNPLTLPQGPINPGQIMHAGKLIPFVPGMPGPNSFMIPKSDPSLSKSISRVHSPNRRMIPSPLSLPPTPTPPAISPHPKPPTPITPRNIPTIRVADVDNLKALPRKTQSLKNGFNQALSFPNPQPTTQWSPAKKKFNFSRMADNLSPRKPSTETAAANDPEYRYFDFDKTGHTLRPHDIKPQHIAPLHIDVTSTDESPAAEQPPPQTTHLLIVPKQPKFLRPSSLPLKPGTFTPKHHHGITPTANTLPLISPETPRPSKNCVQLYLNGHAYTYLGLKCSTKTFYCTVNRPQPVHFTNQHKLSIYSNWQICAESNPHPLGLSPKIAMSLYDSRQSPLKVSTAKMGPTCIMLHSQSLLVVTAVDGDGPMEPEEYRNQSQQLYATNSRLAANARSHLAIGEPPVPGGYESTEDYTYVRGRGRGKYVCSECGIRCKKPSMLKKHIRTHTDVRPYTCSYCSFSFKTKGNLTKHMKSKAHYKKCKELGLNPLPMDEDGMDDDMDCDSESGDHTSTMPGDSDSDDMSDGDDGGNDSSDNEQSRFRMPEHEAAKSLLFLSQTPRSHNASPNLLIPGRPMTYPYGGKIELPQVPICSTSTLPLSVQGIVEPGSDFSATRRSISFTSPVVDYVPLKQEQYYSNPKIGVSPREDGTLHKIDEYSMPMDLTKPRESIAPAKRVPVQQSPPKTSISEMLSLGQSGAAGLLTSLVTITDSLPQYQTQMQPSIATTDIENTLLLQSYLTERALQDTKMKQSQIYRTQLPNTSYVTTLTASMGYTTSTMSMTKATGLNNGLLLAIPNCSFPAVGNPIDLESSTRSTYILKEPNRKVTAARPSPKLNELVVSTTEHSSTVHPFDALKNSPNPSKVTYSKIPLADSVSWSVRANAEQPTPTVSHAEPTVVYSLTDVPTKVTITVNDTTDMISSNEHSTIGMDTLAEIAASSVKLDTTKALSLNEDNPSAVYTAPTLVPPNPIAGNSAKSVATEYLKRTSAEYMKAHFNKSDREESDESDSEGEPNMTSSDPVTSSVRTVVVGEDGFKTAPPTTTADVATVHRGFIQEDGRSVCKICSKTFPKKHQMILHMNIHYMERKYRCEPCGVGFRTASTLQKHERGEAHKNKVLMTSTFGVPTTTNPRPFECSDCKIAFRIHGHLAKHLRSKTHVQKLECLQKLPFGTYAEIERASVSLTDIDTTDCENSLASLRVLAQRLLDKDPSKWPEASAAGKDGVDGMLRSTDSSNSDDGGEPIVSADDEGDNLSGPEPGADKRKTDDAGEYALDAKRPKLSGGDP